jgi:hypothetical protein
MTRYATWFCTSCPCSASIEVDTEEQHLYCKPCEYHHVFYCMYVAYDVLKRKIAEMSEPWRKDIQTMEEMIRCWKPGNVFMRNKEFEYDPNGLTAYQAYWDWESKGITLPNAVKDPSKLADLVQAKKNREFTIDQWMDIYWGTFEQSGVTRYKRDEYMIWPEEYLSHLGVDVKLFKKLFGREPNQDIINTLQGGSHEAILN